MTCTLEKNNNSNNNNGYFSIRNRFYHVSYVLPQLLLAITCQFNICFFNNLSISKIVFDMIRMFYLNYSWH